MKHTKFLTTIQPRKIFDQYWYYACERQKIYLKRISGQSLFLTNDPILQEYKFCNTFRSLDRESQHLIREVIYGNVWDTDADLLFNIILFRFFSKFTTWTFIKEKCGRPPTIDDLLSGKIEKALSHLKNCGKTMYTNAFILCANDAFNMKKKHLNHLALFVCMFESSQFSDRIFGANSLESVFNTLKSYPLIGDFMAYQISVDINYSTLIDFSENDFTKAGPGAKRGIRKAFENYKAFSDEDIILKLVKYQDLEFERLGLSFPGLFGRKLHAIDIQGLFCEFDKYCRIYDPNLKSARKRMKNKFNPRPNVEVPFLPPKWEINILNSSSDI